MSTSPSSAAAVTRLTVNTSEEEEVKFKRAKIDSGPDASMDRPWMIEETVLGDVLGPDDYVPGINEEQKAVVETFTIKTLRKKLSEVSTKNKQYFSFVQRHLVFRLDKYLKTGEKVVEDKFPNVGMRRAAQDFGFSQELTHMQDVRAFETKLNEVRDWHKNASIRNAYLAPLLPVIQSSGTGKSRLLHFVRQQNDASSETDYRSILLTDEDKANAGVQDDSYDEVYQVKREIDRSTMEEDLRKLVLKHCLTCERDNVTLFFDEAQHLMTDQGFLLRVLRWIIREKNFPGDGTRSYKITVVLAGTNPRLANFFPENEEFQSQGTSSRYLKETKEYYEGGNVPFEPFFTLRTQGCLSQREGLWKMNDVQTEYQEMIRFSRPLFALLHSEGNLDKNTEYDIALKILLGNGSEWIRDQRACLSVLATRVQMGSTNTSVVSDLVSKGYAHLTFFQNKNSIHSDIPSQDSFAYLPDPVCAPRISMCLMDEDIRICRSPGIKTNSPKNEQFVLRGKGKEALVNTMGQIFSGGMCLPAKGDLGEVAVALYLLFCGDILRKEHNEFDTATTYHRLSVDFYRWMGILWNGGKNENSEMRSSGVKEEFLVNCIQFFRFSFRNSMRDFAEQSFLKSLYEKGCAIYCSTNTEAIDLVIPCSYRDGKEYIPIFVSVKNYGYMSPNAGVGFLKESLKALSDAGIEKGLLLLGIAGQDSKDKKGSDAVCADYEAQWNESMRKDPMRKKWESIASLVTRGNVAEQSVKEKLRIGFFCVHKDEFGIHEMLLNSSFVKRKQAAEVYCMHSELIHGLPTTKNPPASYRKDAKAFFKDTFQCIRRKEGFE